MDGDALPVCVVVRTRSCQKRRAVTLDVAEGSEPLKVMSHLHTLRRSWGPQLLELLSLSHEWQVAAAHIFGNTFDSWRHEHCRPISGFSSS